MRESYAQKRAPNCETAGAGSALRSAVGRERGAPCGARARGAGRPRRIGELREPQRSGSGANVTPRTAGSG